jgi:hypothetical protein
MREDDCKDSPVNLWDKAIASLDRTSMVAVSWSLIQGFRPAHASMQINQERTSLVNQRDSLLHFDLEIALTGSPVWLVCTSTVHGAHNRCAWPLRVPPTEIIPTLFRSHFCSLLALAHQLMGMA